MKPLLALITLDTLEELASRSNFRYGKEIAEDGEIAFEKLNTFNLVAKIKNKNHETRTVHLESTPKGLRWKCTCSAKKGFFCQHCVAAGIKVQEKGI